MNTTWYAPPCLKLVLCLGSLFLSIICLAACDPVRQLSKVDLGDVHPPELASQQIADDGSLHLVFDEAVSLVPDSLHLNIGSTGSTAARSSTGSISLQPGVVTPGREIDLVIAEPTEPGREYAVEIAVRDPAGNSLTLVVPFFGPNPHPAALRLNEVLPKLSSSHRDSLELLVTSGGNLGGATVFLGLPDDYDACYTFPAMVVKTGDFVILHCKPEGKPGEIDETDGVASASGLNASPQARDFWWRDAPGLPDETGIISLAANPLGQIKDAVFYSNKTTVAGKDYRSFGTKKLLDRAEELQRLGAWKCQQTTIAVEDAASSVGLTSTRSLCRDANASDSDRSSDWHVVPSGKASLGGVNADERYLATN